MKGCKPMTQTKQTSVEIDTRAINELLSRAYGDLIGRPARWTYYASKRTTSASRKKDMYFYTTQRVGGKFVSGIYRYRASKKTWVAMKKRSHRKRRDAASRALKLREQEA